MSLAHFFSHGYVCVPAAISATTVDAFVSDLSTELARGIIADSGASPPVELGTPATWPCGRSRRVLECVPRGSLPHWEALRSSCPLRRALDSLIGPEGWELRPNEEGEDGRLRGPRRWYAPVTFPEFPGRQGDRPHADNVLQTPCQGPRNAVFMSCAEEEAQEGAAAPWEAHLRWQPVSRRRFLNKGWHLDIGPGFPGVGLRSVHGDHRQCCVVLLLLTDWLPGGGGTCVVPGSHLWVLRDILRGGSCPPTHEGLNLHCVARMRAATEAGRVRLGCSCPESSQHGVAAAAAAATHDIEGTGPIHVEQICGRAGDVILMHPLLLHSGTTNMREGPRILLNGMITRLESLDPCPIIAQTLGFLQGPLGSKPLSGVTLPGAQPSPIGR